MAKIGRFASALQAVRKTNAVLLGRNPLISVVEEQIGRLGHVWILGLSVEKSKS